MSSFTSYNTVRIEAYSYINSSSTPASTVVSQTYSFGGTLGITIGGQTFYGTGHITYFIGDVGVYAVGAPATDVSYSIDGIPCGPGVTFSGTYSVPYTDTDGRTFRIDATGIGSVSVTVYYGGNNNYPGETTGGVPAPSVWVDGTILTGTYNPDVSQDLVWFSAPSGANNYSYTYSVNGGAAQPLYTGGGNYRLNRYETVEITLKAYSNGSPAYTWIYNITRR
jgi:hypothetical protein